MIALKIPINRCVKNTRRQNYTILHSISKQRRILMKSFTQTGSGFVDCKTNCCLVDLIEVTLVDEDAHSKVADIEVGIVECSSDSSVTADSSATV